MNEILVGDAAEKLLEIPDASMDCCVTSPPYFGLRDYGVDGQIGLERTPGEFVDRLVAVFREVRRALRPDGTLWLNMGDSYAGSWGAQGRQGTGGEMDGRSVVSARQIGAAAKKKSRTGSVAGMDGLKAKDLVGIPWRLAFALQADGWWLRSDIIWAKPNPMPESITDRPTKAHEYVFLLSKSERYFYDADAIREPHTMRPQARPNGPKRRRPGPLMAEHTFSGTIREGAGIDGNAAGRNKRTVWTIPTSPFPEAHFATFPEKLVEPCILAGSRPGGGCWIPSWARERRPSWP